MLLMTIAMQSVGTIGFYVSTYYVLGGDKAKAGEIAGWGGTAMMFFSTVTIPLFTWLSRKIGKIPTLYICGASYLLSTFSQWWLITPAHPYWQIISAALIGPAVTGTWLILPSMQTDVVDYDELKTGCRREGAYTAILGWIQKLGFSLAAILAGVILKISGFDVALEGAQTAETLTKMRVIYVFFPMVMAGIMILLIRFYPLSERRCHEIRQELEKRRGELHGTREV
jgi:GPH family glycoside/pentoside/hexuronide:cation symporter